MPLWTGESPLVLASQSAIRHQILRNAGIPHEIDPANLDERRIEGNMGCDEIGGAAMVLARAKALAVAARRPGRTVIGADQILTVEEQRLSKPNDKAAAR